VPWVYDYDEMINLLSLITATAIACGTEKLSVIDGIEHCQTSGSTPCRMTNRVFSITAYKSGLSCAKTSDSVNTATSKMDC